MLIDAGQIDWPTFWSAATSLISFGLFVVTGVYAWLTFRLARAAEQQSWELSRARLNISLKTNQGGQFFIIAIENLGSSAAYDLRIELDRPVHDSLGEKRNIGDLPILSRGIRALQPNAPVFIGLGVTFSYLNEEADRALHPLSFEFTARYMTGSRIIEERFPIDAFDQYSMTSINKDYLDEFGRTFPEEFRRAMRDLKAAISNSR